MVLNIYVAMFDTELGVYFYSMWSVSNYYRRPWLVFCILAKESDSM